MKGNMMDMHDAHHEMIDHDDHHAMDEEWKTQGQKSANLKNNAKLHNWSNPYIL